jgi:protease IV
MMMTMRIRIGAALLLAMFLAVPASAKKPKGKKPPATANKIELTEEAAAKESQPRIAAVRLSGAIPEGPAGFSLFEDPDKLTLKDWLERLAKARKDEQITAVALEIGSAGVTWAQAQELADAVRRLDAVKPVHAYLSGGGASGYLVASAAREVSMDPAASLDIVGLAAEMMFFRGTLDWVGIKPQMIQIGQFKGAAEPYMNKKPSEQFQRQYDQLLDDLYDQLCGQIADQRKLKIARVRTAIDNGPFDAESARGYGLVDRLIERADWRDHVGDAYAAKGGDFTWVKGYGKKASKSLDFSNPFALLGALVSGPPKRPIADPTIAIIHADGVIMEGAGGQSLFGTSVVGSTTLTKAFKEVTEDDRIKAVVFRINSPGGSAMASELISQAVRRCAKVKPVIVSVAGMAASGGYYIAAPGKTIIADPSAVVGSIGVISGKLSLTGLFDKIGVSTHEFTRGKNAGLMMMRPWDEREQEVMRKQAQRIYDLFARRVKEGRGKKIKDIDAVAHGRVFTARQAVRNGLVDQVGGFREAVSAALADAKLDKCGFLVLPRPKTLLDLLQGSSDSRTPVGTQIVGALGAAGPLQRLVKHRGLAYLLTVAELLGTDRVLTAMPHYLSVQP